MKLLIHTDSPCRNTGFGKVCRELITRFPDEWDIEVVGVNHWGRYELERVLPCFIHPAVTGRIEDTGIGIKQTITLLDTGKYDVFLTMMDYFQYAEASDEVRQICDRHDTKWIGYWPVDSPVTLDWSLSILRCDEIVFYTKYGQAMAHPFLLGRASHVIGHGVSDAFRPLVADPIALRRSLFPGAPTQTEANYVQGPLWLSVNKNQIRKNIPELLQAFASFVAQTGTGFLLLKMSPDHEYDIRAMMASLGVDQHRWACINKELPDSVLNKLYNCADLFITTTHGEGWGMTVAEAAAAGVPVVAPRNTSLPEVAPASYFYDNDAYVNYGPHDLSRFRPCGGDILGAVMDALRPDPDRIMANQDARLSWESVASQFVNLIAQTALVPRRGR
jgi:glycosyltransferase involved in cell wall biosynthesis